MPLDRHVPLAFVALAAVCVPVHAQVGTSNTILFQSRVETPEGDPLPDGAYPMQFRIYATKGDNTTLWTETQPAVTITDGLSNTLLFSETPPPSNIFDEWDSLWLEVALDRDNGGFESDDIFKPRTPQHEVPFALHAQDAAMLGGEGPEAFARVSAVERQYVRLDTCMPLCHVGGLGMQ
ncbi:MAG: hypothetical protein GC168_13775 [Candidatus Hydrogenedens sp.]|nr:hypothetical protein [Candidatus Hydrogenedens sp.]